MEILSDVFKDVRSLIPTVLAIAGIVIFIGIARYIVNRQSKQVESYRFRRQLLTFLLSLVGILIVILVLPIGDTLRGQLLSLFGILLTAAIALSATTFMGNIMAGLMLRAIGGFKPGDFISTDRHFGRITELGLFHIEIQTEFRDLTTIPNVFLVTHPIKVIRSSGTIVTAEVSLGYDISRTIIEQELLGAAEAAGLQKPFVHVIELGDFSVSYRVAGLLEDVKQILSVRSKLREMMLDYLQNAGIEIVSPTFMNTRAFPPEKRFISKTKPQSKFVPKGSFNPPEKLVFDKADSAESIQKMKDQYTKYEEEQEEINQRIKDKEYSGDDPEVEKYLADIDKFLENLAGRIKQAEEANNEDD